MPIELTAIPPLNFRRIEYNNIEFIASANPRIKDDSEDSAQRDELYISRLEYLVAEKPSLVIMLDDPTNPKYQPRIAQSTSYFQKKDVNSAVIHYADLHSPSQVAFDRFCELVNTARFKSVDKTKPTKISVFCGYGLGRTPVMLALYILRDKINNLDLKQLKSMPLDDPRIHPKMKSVQVTPAEFPDMRVKTYPLILEVIDHIRESDKQIVVSSSFTHGSIETHTDIEILNDGYEKFLTSQMVDIELTELYDFSNSAYYFDDDDETSTQESILPVESKSDLDPGITPPHTDPSYPVTPSTFARDAYKTRKKDESTSEEPPLKIH